MAPKRQPAPASSRARQRPAKLRPARPGPAEDAREVLGLALQNPRGYRDVKPRVLLAWLEQVLVALAPKAGSLAARLTSDAELRRLNRTFRGKDKPTDVLSFPGERTADGYHVGDIVISVPTARRQAAEAGHGLQRELQILLLHGLLHCLGYDHETDDGAMERRERRLRKRWIADA